MSNRLATRIGLPSAEERPADAFDLAAFHEPSVGALARTKGSLFLLAQLTGGSASLAKAAQEALDAIQRDYYYDLSAGVVVSLAKALAGANRRLYHARKRLGIPRRSGVSVVAVVIRGHEAHAAKLGPASAVIVRDGRMYEVPPPPAVTEEDPRIRRRRVAATLGEALEVEPYTWQGALAPGDRIALVSRHFAHTVGVEELKGAIGSMRPAQAVEHLQHLFAIRGGSGSDGILAVEVTELPSTATTHHLEPVRPAEPFAGLPDQSPVPLADAIGRGLHRAGDAAEGAKGALGRGLLTLMSWILAFVPHRRPEYPRSIPRTSEREEGRRRRVGLAGMVVVAGILAVGATVAGLPGAHPTDAIPRASIARESIAEAVELVAAVEERVGGADLVDRDPEEAVELLTAAHAAVERASGVGVAEEQLAAAAEPDRAAPGRPLPGRPRRRGTAGHRPRRLARRHRRHGHGRRERRFAVDPGLGARAHPARRPGGRDRDRPVPRRAGPRDRGHAGRSVAARDGGDRRRRGRPAANGVADRPRRAHPAPHAARRHRARQLRDHAARGAPASAAARDLQPLPRRRRRPARSSAGALRP